MIFCDFRLFCSKNMKCNQLIGSLGNTTFKISHLCIVGVRPFKCTECDKAFTQRCSLESHARKVHQVDIGFGYKERRNKVYVCEDCGHSTDRPEEYYDHLKRNHPDSPVLLRRHDKRLFKFNPPSPAASSSAQDSVSQAPSI